MGNKIIIRVLFLGVFCIIGIITVQTYWVRGNWEVNKLDFNNAIVAILYNTASQIAQANKADLPKMDIIKQTEPNYYIVNIDSEIDPVMLESFLREEIESEAINIDFEFGIYDCHSKEMLYQKYCQYELKSDKENEELLQLPLSENETANYYFGIRFPTRNSYLLSKMRYSILFSFILFVTIIFFAYSIRVILKQNRLSRMQKEFINNMTHEFKTPISTIKIAADVFLKNPIIQENERLNTYANIIKQQNHRLNNQVERVLNLAKFEKNNFNLKKEDLPIKSILNNLIKNESIRIKEKGGDLSFKAPAEEFIVKADRFHFSNIIHNLIDNSIKYSKEKPKIEIELKSENKKIQISIKDNGIGIPKEHQSQVFEKFYRIPTGNVHNVKGFGIGLYYVKKICEGHQWSINLRSKINEFTRFDISIPK